jgi:hypothetical protein
MSEKKDERRQRVFVCGWLEWTWFITVENGYPHVDCGNLFGLENLTWG